MNKNEVLSGDRMNVLEEIIYQLKCVKNHLDFLNTEYIPIDFDVKVLEVCVSQLEEINNNSLIFPHTIGDITFYNKDELFEWVKNQQKLNEILRQEGYLKTQHTCSEKWFIKNKNLSI